MKDNIRDIAENIAAVSRTDINHVLFCIEQVMEYGKNDSLFKEIKLGKK